MPIDLWFKWGEGAEQGQSHVEDPSEKNLIKETFLFREVVSHPEEVNYMSQMVMIRFSVGVRA